MKIAQKLNYDLQAYQERLGLVNFLIENGEMDGYPPSELDKVANYLLYAEDVDAEVELKEGNKRKVSYEELIESTLGESTIQKQGDMSIYRIPKPRIDRSVDGDIPGMRDLWEAIDVISEQYQYCKDVLDGKRDMDPNRVLVPTFQKKYFLREWMIDLRREQFLLKDAFKPVIGTKPGFGNFAIKHDEYGMCVGPHILCPGSMMVDFGNWQHIYAMLKNYSGMKGKLIDNPFHPWWDMYDFLDELLERVRWSPEHEHILIRKIDKIPNEQIAKELYDINGKSYSVNYISTIWKQHISKQIVKYAYLWWNEKQYRPDGTLRNMMKWKVCAECGRQLFVDELNFSKDVNGEYKDICKDCAQQERDRKNKLREERKAKREAKKENGGE